jgi:ribosomal protein L37AE/L43A
MEIGESLAQIKKRGIEMRTCPFCNELIDGNAIKCSHCGEFLHTQSLQSTSPMPQSNIYGKSIPAPEAMTSNTNSSILPSHFIPPPSSKRESVWFAGTITNFLHGSLLVTVGVLLCLTIIGAIFGIPLILAGIARIAGAPAIALGYQKVTCPYCHKTDVLEDKRDATQCKYCKSFFKIT